MLKKVFIFSNFEELLVLEVEITFNMYSNWSYDMLCLVDDKGFSFPARVFSEFCDMKF